MRLHRKVLSLTDMIRYGIEGYGLFIIEAVITMSRKHFKWEMFLEVEKCISHKEPPMHGLCKQGPGKI